MYDVKVTVGPVPRARWSEVGDRAVHGGADGPRRAVDVLERGRQPFEQLHDVGVVSDGSNLLLGGM